MDNRSLRELGIVTAIGIVVSIIFYIVVFCNVAHACSRDKFSLDGDTLKQYERLRDEANKIGIKIIITCAYRSQSEQDLLYAQGRTKPGKIVTWVKESRHTLGKAFDVAIIEGCDVTWDPDKYRILGQIGQKLGLVWGGSWKVQDLCHFEMREKT